jgi:putative oxidoreductase
MLKKLFQTDDGFTGFIARVVLGIVFLPHGLQKLLGLFGGYGFSGTADSFVSTGLPSTVAVLIIIGESFGSAGLILGFLSRVGAFGIILIMLGAVSLVHIHNGFFMNWFGNQKGEGFEYHILAIGLALIILIKGGGGWSVDGLLMK